jgi:formylglycine-generating enzyme
MKIRKQDSLTFSALVLGLTIGTGNLACSAAAPTESSTPVAQSDSTASSVSSAAPPATAADTPPVEELPGPAPQSHSDTAKPAVVAPAPRCPEGTQLVPGGQFTTATNRTEVTVADLCVDTFETTAALYKECVDAGKCTTNQVLCSEQSTWGQESKKDHPMVCVDFSQAEAYCSYREKRLPETSEWEWVARGGDAARKYPWGNDEPDQQLCWQGKKALTGTCAVGSFPEGKSAHGIYDLSGSVHEYTTTAQDAYGPVRIARGGSWKEGDPHMMWPGRIGGFETTYRCGFLGIRCVNEAPPEGASAK